jgi:MFS family permease
MAKADAVATGQCLDLSPNPIATSPGLVRWYVVAILALVYALNIADRYVVSTVLESIRLDLHLTDSGVAFLTGVSLALFYLLASIPLSALADRSNRRNIIAGAIVLWSAMTLCCGFARTFWQMLFARIGVGIGEAGASPISSSLLADWFRPRERAMALSFFALGSPLGAWLGADVAGRLADLYGWRGAFFGLGIPGVFLGLLIFTTMREPRRGGTDLVAPPPEEAPIPLIDKLRFIWRQRAAMHLMMGGAVTALWGWGLMWWTPTYLMRAYGMTAGGAGTMLGPIHLVSGSLATILTGRIMAMRAMAEPRNVLRLMAVVVALTTIPSVMIFYTHDLGVAKLCLWLFVPAMYFYVGPSLGLLQNVVPARMRATATAVTFFMANVANLVIAPQFVGFVSDFAGGKSGATAATLRLALLMLAPTGLWAAYHYWAAIRGFRADEARALSYG